MQKTLMWIGFKRHKFNNSHFILVTKVTIHHHKKKIQAIIQYMPISIPTIAAKLKCMGRRNTAFHVTPEVWRHQVPNPSFDISSIQYPGISETKVHSQVSLTLAKHILANPIWSPLKFVNEHCYVPEIVYSCINNFWS